MRATLRLLPIPLPMRRRSRGSGVVLKPPWLRFVLGLAIGLAAPVAPAQSDVQATEARIKAVFLFKFADYVEWPKTAFATNAAPFTVGVVESEAVARELARVVEGRAVQGRPVVVRSLRGSEPVDGVQLLFVGREGRGDLGQILARLRGRPVLRVTESEGALQAGSMINFVLVDGKVRFDIVPPDDAGGLRISSRLLAVARDVQERS
jgi:hypothetical protein